MEKGASERERERVSCFYLFFSPHKNPTLGEGKKPSAPTPVLCGDTQVSAESSPPLAVGRERKKNGSKALKPRWELSENGKGGQRAQGGHRDHKGGDQSIGC